MRKQFVDRASFFGRTCLRAGCPPALTEIPFLCLQGSKKGLVPQNNCDLPPRKNQNTLGSNVFRSHEGGCSPCPLYRLITQLCVQSWAGREALSTGSGQFRTAIEEKPCPFAGLFFRNHTLARHRPNRGPTTNITKALHKAIRIHHLRTLGHSIGAGSNTNSGKAKKMRVIFVCLESARRDASGKDQLSFPFPGGRHNLRVEEFDPVGALVESMAKGLTEEPELVTAVTILREGSTLYRLRGHSQRYCQDRRKTPESSRSFDADHSVRQ
jgi:hypothetical protein